MKRWIIAFLIAAPVGMGALYGVGCAIGANFCGPSSPSKGVVAGDRLYAINCVRCHGAAGEGGPAGDLNVPPLRSGPAASMTLEQLMAKISKGRPFRGMPAFALGPGHLSDQQIESLARYVMSLRGTP